MTARRLSSATPKSNRRPKYERSFRHRETRHKRKQSPEAAECGYVEPVPQALHEAIEIERGNLSTAESVLGCLAVSMEYGADSANAPYYPDVARLARDLVRQSINGLDSLSLQRHLLRDKVKEDCGMALNRACSAAALCADCAASYLGAISELSMVMVSREHTVEFASGMPQ